MDTLSEVEALIKAGQKSEARKLLHPFIEANLHNIPAWLLEAETCATDDEKNQVLSTCLRFNPAEHQILQALASLEAEPAPSPAVEDPGKQPTQITDPRPVSPVETSPRSRTIIIGLLAAVVIILGLLYLAVINVTCVDAPGARPCLRVLFIGNSFTQVNDLPGMFANLARSGGHKIETDIAASGGWTLTQHAASPDTLAKIKSVPWDFVVLQEQSQIPSIEESRAASMFPGARTLVSQVRAVHASPIFFQTWAHSPGWPENGMPNYESMQAQIDLGYQQISQELNVPVAPVGTAWLTVKGQYPLLSLWQDDGIHPNPKGTYLAACVFYAVIYRQTPVGLSYTADLPQDTARLLQTAAANVVLKNTQQWNLP